MIVKTHSNATCLRCDDDDAALDVGLIEQRDVSRSILKLDLSVDLNSAIQLEVVHEVLLIFEKRHNENELLELVGLQSILRSTHQLGCLGVNQSHQRALNLCNRSFGRLDIDTSVITNDISSLEGLNGTITLCSFIWWQLTKRVVLDELELNAFVIGVLDVLRVGLILFAQHFFPQLTQELMHCFGHKAILVVQSCAGWTGAHKSTLIEKVFRGDQIDAFGLFNYSTQSVLDPLVHLSLLVDDHHFLMTARDVQNTK